MKKNTIILIVLLIALVTIGVVLFQNIKVFKDEPSTDDSGIISQEEKKQVIDNIVEDIEDEPENASENTSEKTKNNETDKGYDEYLVASGYSGASDNVYYTKDGSLYHLVLSTKKITKIAEGVSKIESGKGSIQVYKGNNFKILIEDNYLTYME